MVRLDTEAARSNIDLSSDDARFTDAREAHQTLLDGTGAGSEFLGWRDLLIDPNDALIEDIAATARQIRRDADVLLCIGIGGSYLGAKAVIEALTPYLASDETPAVDSSAPDDEPTDTEVLFAGHHLSGAYLRQLLDYLDGKSVYVNVISKSGTTLEPALAFRYVRQWLEEQFDDAYDRIIVTTDPSEGALNKLKDEFGFKKYVIPRDVGGRFSVLTPVGLLPIATAGIDIRTLFYGAVSECEALTSADDNAAIEYAAVRKALLDEGFSVEVLAHFEPNLAGIGGWWQQLFGESEGKENTGLYPDVVQYSTDLHSLGQYMQEGQRILAETFLMVENDRGRLPIPSSDHNLDGLDYLSGRTMSEVTRKAYEGTAQAHAEGGVPVSTISIEQIDAESLGGLIYFYEHAVAVSGYLLGVNPFDQSGVEAYKSAMFSLLGRP